MPSAIVGDLDSTRGEVLQYYISRGVTVVHDEDQENSDIEKTLKLITQNVPSEKYLIIAYGTFSGRIDQTIATMNTLMKFNLNWKNK